MYNLLISGHDEAWGGEPFQLELDRCVREYTDADITARFGDLDSSSVNALRRFPCIFGYERACDKDPHFGLLRDVVKRQGEVRIEYELIELESFLIAKQLAELSFELDIGKLELHRTHWAVKDVDLARELHQQGVDLPSWARAGKKAVDITSHHFDVALSFPGEVRSVVESVAGELERLIGPNSYFYDDNYVSQLARPSLDLLLQEIYRDRSRLVVVFVCGDYQNKEWCGIEFDAVREILKRREHDRVMYIRVGEGQVDGVLATDGYVDASRYSPEELAQFIRERVDRECPNVG